MYILVVYKCGRLTRSRHTYTSCAHTWRENIILNFKTFGVAPSSPSHTHMHTHTHVHTVYECMLWLLNRSDFSWPSVCRTKHFKFVENFWIFPSLVGLAKKSVGGGRVVEPFSEFLKTLRKPAAQDIREHLKRYIGTCTYIRTCALAYICMSVCL